MGRSIELELIPRQLAQAPALARPGMLATPNAVIGAVDVEAFVAACLAQEEMACPVIVGGLLESGTPPERICLDLLTPAAQTLGVRWEEEDADFLEVTLGLGRMHRVLRDLGRRVADETAMSEDAGQAFLCGVPEEQHSLGLAIVTECFVADGWGVTVGPPIGLLDAVCEVRAHWYDVVGITVGIVERGPQIEVLIRAIRASSLNPNLAVLVGGRALADVPDMVARVGADASAPDAAQGPMVARTLVQARRAARANHGTLSAAPSS